MYSWESSGKKRKQKKSGTVVFHPDASVPLEFERYTQPVKLTREKNAEGETELKSVTLMTEDTAKRLQKAPFKFTELLPSQAQCYRGIYKGRDAILHSRTGSGKTLAYMLPLVERFLTEGPKDLAESAGPFLLIFVFSTELAHQTKSIADSLYASRGVRIAIAGTDDVTSEAPHILIGTVSAIDVVVRGESAKMPKRVREEEGPAAGAEDDEGSDDDEEESESDSEDDVDGEGLLDVSGVRAIVVDECDTTLGPRFSKDGRRMKFLLKHIRRANGSLDDKLMSEFRAHHYILVGATIPNWVIKAGFLGIKKYYYQLVQVGLSKLPSQLECFAVACPKSGRLAKIRDIINDLAGKRIVVFLSAKSIPKLEQLMRSGASTSAPTPGKSSKKAASSSAPVLRSLHRGIDEMDRVQAIAEYNSLAANVMLCTDVAARGLDFVDVEYVLMESLPSNVVASEVFVHRAGRTARVNKTGSTIVLYDPADERSTIEAIETSTHVTLKRLAKYESDSKGGAAAGAQFTLKVKSAFGSDKTRTAMDVLKAELDSDYARVANAVSENEGSVVRFTYPLDEVHTLKSKLWKFDLREAREKK